MKWNGQLSYIRLVLINVGIRKKPSLTWLTASVFADDFLVVPAVSVVHDAGVSSIIDVDALLVREGGAGAHWVGGKVGSADAVAILLASFNMLLNFQIAFVAMVFSLSKQKPKWPMRL